MIVSKHKTRGSLGTRLVRGMVSGHQCDHLDRLAVSLNSIYSKLNFLANKLTSMLQLTTHMAACSMAHARLLFNAHCH